MKLLQFCLDATYLAYRGEFLKQMFGTAMSSSVTVANLVMASVKERALSTYFLEKVCGRHSDCLALRPGQRFD